MILKPGEHASATVAAKEKWNSTAIELTEGGTYRFEASGQWFDASIQCGPDGYRSPNLILRLGEVFRRIRDANWFALIGSTTMNDSAAFLIGQKTTRTITTTGMLFCFANDVCFMYGNNRGQLQLTVTRIE
jgi:hypothetical protein